MHNRASLFLLITCLCAAGMAPACDKVVGGYETNDVMYVLCDDLSGISDKEAEALLRNIMHQYKGPPDEVVVYFVKSQKSVGDPNPAGDALVGSYYTHDSVLEISPGSKTKKRVIQIPWL